MTCWSTARIVGPLLAVSCLLCVGVDSTSAQSLFPSNQQQNSSRNTGGGGGGGSLGQTGTDFGSTPGIAGAGQVGPGGIAQQQAGGFTGGNDSSGRFVGSQNASQQRVQNFGQFGNLGQGFGGGSQPANQTPKRTIRPLHRVAFTYNARQTTAIRTSIGTNFGRIRARRPELDGVQFTLADSGNVTLTGTVADSHTRKLAAMLVRMEPGVRKVENKLTVAGDGKD